MYCTMTHFSWFVSLCRYEIKPVHVCSYDINCMYCVYVSMYVDWLQCYRMQHVGKHMLARVHVHTYTCDNAPFNVLYVIVILWP